MAACYPQDDEPLIPMAALTLTLDALRQAAAVVPSPCAVVLPVDPGLVQPGRRRGKRLLHPALLPALGRTVAIERRPPLTARLHAAEHALADPDADVRDGAVREAAQIVQAAYREVAGS
jgi:hypothetical protein